MRGSVATGGSSTLRLAVLGHSIERHRAKGHRSRIKTRGTGALITVTEIQNH
jgi:hypothetical protein